MKSSDVYFFTNYLGMVFVSKETWDETQKLEREYSDELWEIIVNGLKYIEDYIKGRKTPLDFSRINEQAILMGHGFVYNPALEAFLQPGSYPDYDAMDPTCPPVGKRIFTPEKYHFGIGTMDGQVVELFFSKMHNGQLTAELWGWEIAQIENICETIGLTLYQICEGEFSVVTPVHSESRIRNILLTLDFNHNSDLDRSRAYQSRQPEP